MNTLGFYILYSLIQFARAASASRDRAKDMFLQAAFDYELNLKYMGIRFDTADSLSIDDDVNMYRLGRPRNDTTILYRDDSVYEMFRLIKKNYKVCGNTAAHSRKIGGGFTIFKDERLGKGAQEESVMSLFNGLLQSLEHYAIKNEAGVIRRRHQDKGSYLFYRGTLRRKILHSSHLSPRIPMSLFDDYCLSREGKKRFSDYVEFKYSRGKFSLFNNVNYSINLYSIAGFDRRGKSDRDVKYAKLRTDTELQISKMLLHGRSKGYDAIVITIPGSGVFSNKAKEWNSPKDYKYLDNVELGAIEAISKYGRWFKEIVICGHRRTPKIVFKN